MKHLVKRGKGSAGRLFPVRRGTGFGLLLLALCLLVWIPLLVMTAAALMPEDEL